jgi:hypothetical protein
MTLKFYATVEFLRDQPAAIVTLTDEAGDWAGAGRVEVRSGRRYDLYEEAYRQASQSAQAKGGRLERFAEAASPGCPNCDGCGTVALEDESDEGMPCSVCGGSGRQP